MGRWKAPSTVISALLLILGFCGVLALVGLIGYIGWTTAIIYPPDAAKTYQNTERGPPSDAALIGLAEAQNATREAKAGAVVIPKEAWDEVREELALLQKYSALIEYMKIFIPVFSFLLLSGLTATGFWFVDARVSKLQHESYKEANDRVIEAANELRAAKESYAGIESKLRKFSEHKLDVALFGVEHALSLLNWTSGDMDSAIHHEERALKKITESLVRSKEVDPDSFVALKDWEANVGSTLGYYYADKWRSSRTPSDGKRAIGLARMLPDTLAAAAPSDFASLVDNYLYTLARSGQPLLGSDRQQIVDWFSEYEAEIKEIRTGATATPDDHVFFKEIEALEKECRDILSKKPTP